MVRFSIESIETIYVLNYYDDTVAGNATLLGYIEPTVNYLNTVYRNEFHIKYVMDGAPEPYPYNAATDACPRGATKACNDSCSTDCDQHHKNVKRIAREANNLHTDNHLIILWSNSNLGVYCVEGSSGHSTVPGYAAVVPVQDNGKTKRYPVVQMFTMNKYDSDAPTEYDIDQIFLKLILVHEVAHTLDLEERTLEPNHGYGEVEQIACIMEYTRPGKMEEFYREIQGIQTIFCAECLAALHNQIPDDVYEHFEVPLS